MARKGSEEGQERVGRGSGEDEEIIRAQQRRQAIQPQTNITEHMFRSKQPNTDQHRAPGGARHLT